MCFIGRLDYNMVRGYNEKIMKIVPGALDKLIVNTADTFRLKHFINHRFIQPPFPEDTAVAVFALGCFWGSERLFWQFPGVYVTAVGYAGGSVPEPSYQAVCSGSTGHAESVLVVYRDIPNAYEKLLEIFWQAHDPTQGMRQGNDIGSQYRSVIFCFNDQQYHLALKTREAYQSRLLQAGYTQITTEITKTAAFYYAEDYHQQYLAKNPAGYCGLGGTGVSAEGLG